MRLNAQLAHAGADGATQIVHCPVFESLGLSKRARLITANFGTAEPHALVALADREPLWLVAEWPEGESKPNKFVLTTLPRRMSHKQIVRILKERWRTERMYEDLRGELGLDHFEGRRSRGGIARFNHERSTRKIAVHTAHTDRIFSAFENFDDFLVQIFQRFCCCFGFGIRCRAV